MIFTSLKLGLPAQSMLRFSAFQEQVLFVRLLDLCRLSRGIDTHVLLYKGSLIFINQPPLI